jgi:hypothetical protein
LARSIPAARREVRNRVISAPTPRMATADAPNSQPRSPHRPMLLNRFQIILRTRRLIPASPGRSRQPVQRRRQKPLIKPDQHSNHRLHGASSGGSNPARRIVRTQSPSNSAALTVAATGRGIVTTRKFPRSNGIQRASTICKRRRVRFRTTAFPTFRVTANPARLGPSGIASNPIVTSFPRHVRPFARTKPNSPVRRMRCGLGSAMDKRKRAPCRNTPRAGLDLRPGPQPPSGSLLPGPPPSGLRVTGKVNLGTLRQQALAALLTATGQRHPATFGSHAGAESMLLLAGPLGGLISAFRHMRERK